MLVTPYKMPWQKSPGRKIHPSHPVIPRRRESRGIHSVQQVRVLTADSQCSTPTAHAVARSGFPPARERQVGETHARERL